MPGAVQQVAARGPVPVDGAGLGPVGRGRGGRGDTDEQRAQRSSPCEAAHEAETVGWSARRNRRFAITLQDPLQAGPPARPCQEDALERGRDHRRRTHRRGRYGGSLKAVAPTDLGATAVQAALERAAVDPAQVDQVVFGNVIHSEPADMYMARVGRDEGRHAQGGPGVHRQPALRDRGAGDRVRRPVDRDGRGGRRGRRRCGVDEPRPLLDAGRALGRPHGRQRRGRSGGGRAHRSVRQDPHGRDGREPGRVTRHLARAAGRVLRRIAPARRACAGGGPVRRARSCRSS